MPGERGDGVWRSPAVGWVRRAACGRGDGGRGTGDGERVGRAASASGRLGDRLYAREDVGKGDDGCGNGRGVARPVFEWLAMAASVARLGGTVASRAGGRDRGARPGQAPCAAPWAQCPDDERASGPQGLESREGKVTGSSGPGFEGSRTPAHQKRPGRESWSRPWKLEKKAAGYVIEHWAWWIGQGGRARGFVCLWATGAKGGEGADRVN